MLRDAYREAARDLLDRNRHRLWDLALPIFFLQRHALELVLKDAISTIDEYVYLAKDRAGARPEPPFGHDLADLLTQLRGALAQADDIRQDLSTLPALVERFHMQDERSTWARYLADHRRADLDLATAQIELELADTDLFSMENTPGRSLGWVTEYAYRIHDFLVREERK